MSQTCCGLMRRSKNEVRSCDDLVDHLVGADEQLRRNLRRLRAPLPDESVRRKYLNGRQGNQVATSEHDHNSCWTQLDYSVRCKASAAAASPVKRPRTVAVNRPFPDR